MMKFATESQEIIDFYINEDKKTVTAVLNVPQNIMAMEMLNISNKASGAAFMTTDMALGQSVMLKGIYRGVAYCHSDDEFDEEVGVRVAKLKALRAYYNDRKVVATRIQRIFEDAAKRMAVAANHNDFSLSHIDELLEEV